MIILVSKYLNDPQIYIAAAYGLGSVYSFGESPAAAIEKFKKDYFPTFEGIFYIQEGHV